MQRRSGVGDHGFTDADSFKNLDGCIRSQPDANLPGLDNVVLDHLKRQVVDGGLGDGDPAASSGVERDEI